MKSMDCGYGDPEYRLAVHIGNRIPLEEYCSPVGIVPIKPDQLTDIVRRTGNHWRKIFNVYAKLLFAVQYSQLASWQQLRDEGLLREGCGHALLFTSPVIPDDSDPEQRKVHLIAGKTWAYSLDLNVDWIPLSEDFQVSPCQKMIICPYFDYRQLSNAKIEMLVRILSEIKFV